MADDRLAIDDMLEELRMLRHVVSEVINHCAGGGYVDRRGTLFKDLGKVHRATRDRQVELKQIWPELEHAPWYREADPRYWQNLACNLAWFAGDRESRVEGAWSVVLDSMLETGGTELSSAARAMAQQLGIELRQSHDGGKTWYPVPAMRARLKDATVDELRRELERRGVMFTPKGSKVDPSALWLYGKVRIDLNPGVPDDLGIESFLRRAQEMSGGVIAAGPRDYAALEQFARQSELHGTLTFRGAPIRPTDALLNTEAALDPGPFRREYEGEFTDPDPSPPPPVVHVVHDWIGNQGQRTTLCGQGSGEQAWSETDQGAQVNCDTCIRVRQQMERDADAIVEGVSNMRQVPGGVFGYVPNGRGSTRRRSPR